MTDDRHEPQRPPSSAFAPGHASAVRRAVALTRHHFAGNAEGTAAVLAEINGEADPDQAFASLLGGFTELAATLAVKAYGASADDALGRLANGLSQHEHGLIGDNDDA